MFRARNLTKICQLLKPRGQSRLFLHAPFPNPLRHSTITRSFAKISKKDKDRENFKKRKEQADVPTEIDFSDLEEALSLVLSNFQETMAKLKVGRIIPELFDEVNVVAYGESMALNQIAQVIPRDGTSLSIKVYDMSIQSEVYQSLNANRNLEFEFEIQESSIVVSSDMKNTKEARRQIAVQGKLMLENAKIEVRKLRTSKIEKVRKMKEFISKDVVASSEKEVGKIVDGANAELAKVFKKKEAELLKG